MFLDYFALTAMIVVFIILVYAAIYIHDIPYEMAKERNHPHQDAIHVGGWLSLFTLHAIWPLLWIWANLYKPGLGYGFGSSDSGADSDGEKRINELEQTIAALQAKLNSIEERMDTEAGHD
jgi:hypothetical protein